MVVNTNYMQSKANIIKIGNKLPRGSFSIISEETGKTQKTVGDFFKGKTDARVETYNLIMEVALRILEESIEKNKKMDKRIKALIN